MHSYVCAFMQGDIYSCEMKVAFACTCARVSVRMCLHAGGQTSLSSIVGVVCLVVHDQSVVHKVEAVRAGLVRALHHLTHWKHHTASHSQQVSQLTRPTLHH